MQVKTILNQIQRYRRFVYGEAKFVDTEEGRVIEVAIRSRANSCAVCSGCGQPAPGYDMLDVRRFEFVPLWGILVFLVYAKRRLDCPRCGVTVDECQDSCRLEPCCYATSLAASLAICAGLSTTLST